MVPRSRGQVHPATDGTCADGGTPSHWESGERASKHPPKVDPTGFAASISSLLARYAGALQQYHESCPDIYPSMARSRPAHSYCRVINPLGTENATWAYHHSLKGNETIKANLAAEWTTLGLVSALLLGVSRPSTSSCLRPRAWRSPSRSACPWSSTPA